MTDTPTTDTTAEPEQFLSTIERTASLRVTTTTAAYSSEAKWMADVRRTAQTFGWVTWHQRFSIGTAAGWPDLVLVHPRAGLSVFVELKTDDLNRSRCSPHQVATLDLLVACGDECAVWRPADRQGIDAFLQHRTAMPGYWCFDDEDAPPRLREIRLLYKPELDRLVNEVGPSMGVHYDRRDDTFSPRFR